MKQREPWGYRSHAKVRIIQDDKQRPCVDCGVSYPYFVMDHDHRNPAEKSFSLSWAHVGRAAITIDMIKAELDKCDVVCSNCHRIRTHTYAEDEEEPARRKYSKH
jgi:hypothetical protein